MKSELQVVLLIITAYFLLILGTILWSRFRKTGTIMPGIEEFFLAGRNLGPAVMICTYVGSLFSAFFALGMPSFIYANGIGGLGFILVADIIGILFILTYYKSLRQYALKIRAVSPIECISSSYGSRVLGLLCAVLMIFFLMPYISIQLVGIGKFLEGLTDGEIGYMNGVGAMMIVVAIYLILGGMRAVAYTDLIQTIAIFIGMIGGSLFLVYSNWDSYSSFMNEVLVKKPEHLNLPGPNDFYSWKSFFALSIFSAAIFFQPHLLTRGMMAKDDKQINIMAIGLLAAVLIGSIPVVCYGLGSALLYEGFEPNQIMGHVFKDMSALSLAGLIITGFLMVGVLGASMSTADSLLLTIGQMFTRDIARPFIKIPHNTQILLSRFIMLGVLACAFYIGKNPPKLMGDLVIYSASATAILVPTYLGFLWNKRSLLACYLSIALGITTLASLAITKTKLFGIHEGLITLIVVFSVYILTCYVANRRQRKEHLQTA